MRFVGVCVCVCVCVCSAPKDIYYDHDASEKDKRKDEAIQKKPQQSKSPLMSLCMCDTIQLVLSK